MKQTGLFIGINNYCNGITPMPDTLNSAGMLHSVFTDIGYDAELMLNHNASQDNIVNYLRNLKLESGDIFVFYFFGHCYEHNQNFWLLGPSADANFLSEQFGMLSLSLICKLTDIPGVRRFFILDCNYCPIRFESDEEYFLNNTDTLTEISCRGIDKIVPPILLFSCSIFARDFARQEDEKSVFANALKTSLKNPEIISFRMFREEVENETGEIACFTDEKNSDILLCDTWMTPIEMYEHGNRYYNAFDYEQAIKWYQKAADEGFADAMCRLGTCYIQHPP